MLSQYYPIPQPTVAANILVRRERRLPVPGEVTVRAGQRVEPSDIIAQTMLAAEPVVIDLAADLGISPGSSAKKLIVSVGSQVERDQPLAQRGGEGSKQARSPVAGTFSSFDPATGMATITSPAEPISLHAHLKGVVTDVIPYYGAVIETPATLIRGIFGIGGEQHGVLKVITVGHDEPLTSEIVDAKVTYALVLGGSEVTADALRRMIELGARGVIVGSIRSGELADFLGYPPIHAQAGKWAAEPWTMGASSFQSNGWLFPPPYPGRPLPVPPDFSIIVMEGLGSIPMNSRVFELLAAYDGQEIAVDATTRLRGGLARPEIIIPMSRTTAVRWLEESGPKLEIGKQVRLLSSAYLGQSAQVVALPVGPRAVQSGVTAPVADVTLSSGQKLRVPLVDLEVLE